MPKAYRCAISVCCFGVLAAFAGLPQTFWISLPAVCAFRSALDLECLGCGMTRALAAATHGQFAAALNWNRGVALVLPALLAGALQGLRR
jgi:hypothetical protein